MQITKDKKTALLFGVKNPVGRHCLKLLLQHEAYGQVTVFTDMDLDLKHPRLQIHTVNFEKPEQYQEWIKGDDLYCCLGLKVGNIARDESLLQTEFRHSIKVTRIGAQQKVNQVLLLSSAGSDPQSLIPFLKWRGQIDNFVKALPYWAIHIFKPVTMVDSGRSGNWAGKLARVLGHNLNELSGGQLDKYQPVEATDIARSMVQAAQNLKEGIFVH